MKVFITGVEGFVGRELIKQCGEKGIEVVGADLLENPAQDYAYRKADFRDEHIVDIISENTDAIIHLAALSRDQDCKNKAYECFDINVLGTLNLMRAAEKKDAKQFIFASSEWVYIFENDKEQNEESCIDIRKHTSEYALSKLVSEVNLKQKYAHGFCPVTILRFGIIYGPRKTNWSAVESLCSAVKNNNEVEVGSLKSGRRFMHVGDIARGIIQAIGLKGCETINLTADKVITLGEVIHESEKLFGKKVSVIEKDSKNISVRNPSNKKAKEILRWKPEISLEEGIRTIETYI